MRPARYGTRWLPRTDHSWGKAHLISVDRSSASARQLRSFGTHRTIISSASRSKDEGRSTIGASSGRSIRSRPSMDRGRFVDLLFEWITQAGMSCGMSGTIAYDENQTLTSTRNVPRADRGTDPAFGPGPAKRGRRLHDSDRLADRTDRERDPCNQLDYQHRLAPVPSQTELESSLGSVL